MTRGRFGFRYGVEARPCQGRVMQCKLSQRHAPDLQSPNQKTCWRALDKDENAHMMAQLRVSVRSQGPALRE